MATLHTQINPRSAEFAGNSAAMLEQVERDDLPEETEVHFHFALAKAFEDKKSLFMTVLECYEREAVAPAVEILSGPQSVDGSDRIRMIFQHVIGVVRAGDRRGCLICSAAAGPASEDPDIAKAVHRALDQMRKGFEVAVSASRSHAKLNPTEYRGLADALTTQYVGLRVLVRSRAPVAVVERSAASVQHLLSLAR